jgi:hypothetical protein
MLLVIAGVLASCASDARGPGVNVDRAMQHVAALVELGPRPGDGARSRQAAAYIESQLPGPVERVAVGRVELPALEVLGATVRVAHTANTTDPNLVVRFGPREGKALVVMAHYDTVKTSPGAVDNAAAVGVLLELARVLASEPPPQPVWLVFTANEEVGLVGAEALAAQHANEVELAIALDLIGGDGALSLNGASELIGKAEMRWLANAAHRGGVVVRAPLTHRVISRWWPQAERSDHAAFTRRGVRAFHLYNRGHDGEWIDRAYHSERDGLPRVERAAVDELGRLLRAVAASPVPAHGGDGFWLPVAANTIVSRGWLVFGCWLLAVITTVLLVRLRGARATAPGRHAGLLAGIGCFVVATAVVFALERAGATEQHPASWLHAPTRAVIGELLVLAGGLGLASRLLARFAPWIGARRYLALATVAPLVIGCTFMVLGAAELAWIWLVPAAAAAAAPHLRRFGIVAIAPLGLPLVLVLRGDQLREAAWNGFLPGSVPLVAWVAGLAFPVFAGVAWYLRTHRYSGPLGTFILPMGCLLSAIAGTVLLFTGSTPCTAVQFHEFHLACEVVSGVR